jgi:hypothetical protein
MYENNKKCKPEKIDHFTKEQIVKPVVELNKSMGKWKKTLTCYDIKPITQTI